MTTSPMTEPLKKTTTFLFALLILALLAPLPLAATQVEDDAPIDMELVEAPLDQVLRSFAAISGRELILDPEVEGKLTIALDDVPWREALNQICTVQELSCELLDGARAVLRVRPAGGDNPLPPGRAELINLSLQSASLRETLSTFGIITGREVIVDPALTGNVTLDLHGVPLEILIEEICALSGCRVEWGEGTIHFLPSRSEESSAQRSDIVLAGVDLEAAFEAAAALPVFERFGPPEGGPPEIDLGEELRGTGRVDLDLENATWMEILKAICDPAGCRFEMHYGVPSRLKVVAADTRLEQSVDLDGAETTLAGAAAELAAVHGLEARLGPDLDPAAAVRLPAAPMTWRKAAYGLCRQVSCGWEIDGRQLVLTSRIEPLSTHPLSDVEGVDLAVRFQPTGGEAVGGTARFTWTTSLYTVVAGDPVAEDGSRLLRLSWIPFGPRLQVVLPILGRCDGGILADLEVLEPLRLPLDAPWSARRGGALVELGAVPGDGGSRSASCLKGGAGRLEATFSQRPPSRDAAEPIPAEVPGRPGAYLLVTPPGVGPTPMAAVVALGADRGGRHHLALMRPRTGGAGAEVERLSLGAGEELTKTLGTDDGREFELMLRLAER